MPMALKYLLRKSTRTCTSVSIKDRERRSQECSAADGLRTHHCTSCPENCRGGALTRTGTPAVVAAPHPAPRVPRWARWNLALLSASPLGCHLTGTRIATPFQFRPQAITDSQISPPDAAVAAPPCPRADAA
nr:unnamed protein product [Digitaria exilis]